MLGCLPENPLGRGNNTLRMGEEQLKTIISSALEEGREKKKTSYTPMLTSDFPRIFPTRCVYFQQCGRRAVKKNVSPLKGRHNEGKNQWRSNYVEL